MTNDHKYKLRKHRQTLVENIIVPYIVSSFLKEDILTLWEADIIFDNSDGNIRVEYLLDILCRKPDIAYDKFVAVLRSTNQNHVANILEPHESSQV